MLAHCFPPLQTAGTFRVIRFVRFLPEFGWRCIVGTYKETCHANVSPTLHEEVNPEAEVHRFGCADPGEHLKRWLRMRHGRLGRLAWLPVKVLAKLLATFLCPDSGVLGIGRVYGAIARILRRRPVDAIWITGVPFSLFLHVFRLKREFGLPIVLDLRDPWTYNPIRYRGTNRWRRRVDSWLEQRIFPCADRVVFNTERTRAWYESRYPRMDHTKWRVITNGFPQEEIDAVAPETFDRTTLVHGGATNKRQTGRFVIEAMGRLRKEGVISPETFRYVSYGPGVSGEHKAAQAAGVADMVEFRGRAEHKKVLAAIRGADALLLVGAREHTLIVNCKLYEYLGARKPVIMAGAEDGAAADLIRETGVGTVAGREDVDTITERLRELVAGKLACHRNDEAIRAYGSRALSEKLAGILDELVVGAG